ncbi:unnamed protein product [Adineta steineri]|uniref:F-box domain-containing protein n=1 Tax=Adineta steineri TaxID=433720 RepID=A0A819K7E1_9BILA|nr:unnamed protein product [Adineta steineri]CAF3943519.1 unnamed protein product [Adineta steineri]
MLFMKLPNEIIYHIFDFLKSSDILQSFSHLNHRYDNLIQSYIKYLDLTNGWNGNQQDLQWLSKTIQKLKINRFNFYLINNYQLPQLQSLYLDNIFVYGDWISKMNLKSLTLWFNEIPSCYAADITIPETVVRFSTNLPIDLNLLHTNLIDLNIKITSVIDLIKIVQKIPLVQRLSITFYQDYHMEDDDIHDHETMIDKLEPLNKLNSFSLSTNYNTWSKNNTGLPFNQIAFFIDNYCSNKNILKTVSLQLYFIKFNEELWSTIERYKNIYNHFNFYGLFIVEIEIIEKVQKLSKNTNFAYHIERTQINNTIYIHIYSLPFYFDKFYGFTSCSELNPNVSFSSVRHLYFTETCGTYKISFESLAKRMSNLISINCNINIEHDYNTTEQIIIVDKDIFYHVRSLHFTMRCNSKTCRCREVLCHLLNQIPYLEYLNTSEVEFLSGNYSLPPIKELIQGDCDVQLVNLLIKRLPYLTTLSIGYLRTNPDHMSEIVGPFFINLPLFKSVSFPYGGGWCGNDTTPYGKYIQEALKLIQNMNNSLSNVQLDWYNGKATFYRQ